MLKRPIPSTGELIPVTGLGTWIKFDVNPADKEELNRLHNLLTVYEAHDGKLIDTSPMYGNAEAVIGKATNDPAIKDKFFYATKIWTTGKESGIKQMESSMAKLNRKRVDLMQIHNMVDWETHLPTLRKWKAEEKIRYTGITHYTVASHQQLEDIIKTSEIDFVQFNYSIRVRNAEKSLLNTAMEKGVAVIINEPLEKGSLFSLVRNKPLPGWAVEYDIRSWSQYFLKYIIAHPAVTCIIPATHNPSNLLDNMLAGNGNMPDEKTRRKMVEYIEKM